MAAAQGDQATVLRVRPRGALLREGFEALFLSLMPLALVILVLPPDLRAPLGIPIAAAVALGSLARASRVDLVIDLSGVLVKGFWGTKRLHWSQIEAVELTSVSVMAGGARAPAVGFRTPQGTLAADTTAGVKGDERRELADALHSFAAAHGVPCHLRVIDREWMTDHS